MKEQKIDMIDIIIPIFIICICLIIGLFIYLQFKRYSENEKEIIKKSEEYIKYKECHEINNMFYCK